MKINLIETFKQSTFGYTKQTGKTKFDRETKQTSFVFDKAIKIVCVSDLNTTKIVDNFSDIPDLILNTLQQEIVSKNFDAKKLVNPKIFDGEQLVAKNAIYDSTEHTIYLEVARTKYSVLLSLNQLVKDAGWNQLLFKLGALAPAITESNDTFTMTRKQDGLDSFCGGFVDPKHLKKPFECSAIIESIEELFGGSNVNKEGKTLQQYLKNPSENFKSFCNDLKEFSQTEIKISGIHNISIRISGESYLGTIEAFAPMYTKANSSKINYIYNSGMAKDAKEFKLEKPLNIIKLEANNVSKFVQEKTPGMPLYIPGLIATMMEKYGQFMPPQSLSEFPNNHFVYMDSLVPSLTIYEPMDKQNLLKNWQIINSDFFDWS